MLKKKFDSGGEILDRVAAIVLAGGEGSRLFPLTKIRCKPSVSFGGRYRLIDIPLSNALNSNIQRLFVISQYFVDDLHNHILATYNKEGLSLLGPGPKGEKTWYEGTADAVRKNISHLMESTFDYFVILSGDQLYNIDLTDMVHFAREKSAGLVVASLLVPEEEAKRMGVLKIDADMRVQEFVEKPKEKAVLDRFSLKDKYLASMGIYIFRRDTLLSLLQQDGNDFGYHLIPLQIRQGSTYSYVYKGYWVDIGTIASFYEANMHFLDGKNCLDTYSESTPIYTRPNMLPSPVIVETKVRQSCISQGSVIEADEIIHSVIGLRCRIKKGTKIKNSVVLGNQLFSREFSIGENCIIENAILDEHTRLGNHVRLINEKKLTTYDGDGICIRDGIIIVMSGTSLPDGFSL
jgi:glucose-1-phosphate adenylyltransferase